MKTTKAVFGILTITAALALQANAQSFLTNGLVAFYPFTGNANDASGHGHDGQGTNVTLATDRFGNVGSAYQFNGSNSVVEIASLSSLNLTEVTISAWVKPHAAALAPIVEKWRDYAAPSADYGLKMDSDLTVHFANGRGGAGYYALPNHCTVTTTNPLILGQWYQLVATLDTAGIGTLWVNGTVGAQDTILSLIPPGPEPVRIGLGYFANSPPWYGVISDVFNGSIDDVRIYNRAISGSEVQQLYQYESAQVCATAPSGLVAWWPGDGSGIDVAGTNNGVVGSGVQLVSGEVGTAFGFTNSPNSYIALPNSPIFQPTNNAFTIEAWIKPDFSVMNWDDTILIKRDGCGVASFIFSVLKGDPYDGGKIGNVHLAVGNVTPPGSGFDSASTVPNDGHFHHVAATFDGNLASSNCFLYIDGQIVGGGDAPGAIPLTSSAPVIGADVGCGHYSDAAMDEVSFYNRALAPTEIAAIYAAASAGKCRSASCVLRPPGLISWWPGEGNAQDIVGSNNGALSGGVTFTHGEVGQAFSFNGSSAVVQVPSSPAVSFAPTSPMTVEFWAYRTGTAPVMHLIGKRVGCYGSAGINYQLDFNMTDGEGLVFFTGGGTSGSSNLPMPMNMWTHLAGTSDGSNLCLYINGVLSASSPGTLGSENTAPLLIGGSGDCASFAGLIDEVSIYDRALSAAEITAIYNAGSAGKCRTPYAATATATMVDGFVVAAPLADGGFGYTNTPGVRFIGGGGSGAQAVAVVSNGVVIAVNMLNAGYGYTNTPIVVIAPPFIPQPTMSIVALSLLNFTNLAVGTNYQLQFLSDTTWSNIGTAFPAAGSTFTQLVSAGASPSGYRLAIAPVPGQAYARPQMVNGFVVGATVTSGGSGYTSSPAVTIVPNGSGSNATATATVSNGVVTGITITDAGIGYTNMPTIVIAPPPVNALWPMVTGAMQLNSSGLSPYDNYQLEFTPLLGNPWANLGSPFTPTSTIDSHYVSVGGVTGFFRVKYAP